MALKYKVGDKVRIKSIDWYNENKNPDDNYNVVFADGWHFSKPMSNFCGKELIIERISHAINPPHYMMRDNIFAWTDEMIECKVEEESKPEPKFKVGDKITNGEITFTILTLSSDRYGAEDTFGECGSVCFKSQDEWKIVEEETKPLTTENMNNIIEEAKTYYDSIKDAWICPEGYIFKDENGNVINATKIVLEKKKKEYPKTYEECYEVMYGKKSPFHIPQVVKNIGYKGDLFTKLQRLIFYRDAYWKIAGDEMGLGKPWEPNWEENSEKSIITKFRNAVAKFNTKEQYTFAFPTEEMRDAFYENFKEEIEICKELL